MASACADDDDDAEPELFDGSFAEDDPPAEIDTASAAFDPAEADEHHVAVAEKVTVFMNSDPFLLGDSLVEAEADVLRLRFAHAVISAHAEQFALARSSEGDQISIEFLGRRGFTDEPSSGELLDESTDESDGMLERSATGEPGGPVPILPAPPNDGALYMDGIFATSGDHFRVRVPAELRKKVAAEGEAMGFNRGMNAGDPTAEPEGRSETILGAGNNDPNGISDNIDNRALYGPINAPQTYSNFRRMVQFSANGGTPSVCSGTLVGPQHVATAGHCFWSVTTRRFLLWQLAAGRNGTGVAASSSMDVEAHPTQDNVLWVDPLLFTANGVKAKHDFGLIVLPNQRMGDQVGGWFGWAYSGKSGLQQYAKYNRGYPSCNSNFAPASCMAGHLYGDTLTCDIGDISNTDNDGYHRTLTHSCDTNIGQSGSPMYEFNGDLDAWVLRGVTSSKKDGASHRKVIDSLMTKDRSDQLNWYRFVFP